MIEFFLTLFDVFMNIATWGWWGQSQGDKNSNVHVKDAYTSRRK